MFKLMDDDSRAPRYCGELAGIKVYASEDVPDGAIVLIGPHHASILQGGSLRVISMRDMVRAIEQVLSESEARPFR